MSTLKDVAKRAGVSICTVSRTLAGKDNIREETRQQVMEAVRELNYQPNRLAASLKTGRSFVLVLVVPSITNIYYPRLAKAIEQEADRAGYRLLLCTTDNSPEQEKRLLQELYCQNVAGVIITPTSNEHDHIKRLQEHHIPYIYLNRDFQDDAEHCLRLDNELAAYQAVSFLIENGHTSIGCVFQRFDNISYNERYDGMMRALREHGLSIDPNHMVLDLESDNPDAGVKFITEMLSRTDRPEAVFACTDMLAFSVYQAAYRLGLRIPDDLSVFGYDNCIMANLVAPPLSTFSPPVNALAQTSVQFIDYYVKTGELLSLPLLTGHLVIRESVKCRTGE